MAEWLGELMANWPNWAIIIAVVMLFIVGIIGYYLVDISVFKPSKKDLRRNGKK